MKFFLKYLPMLFAFGSGAMMITALIFMSKYNYNGQCALLSWLICIILGYMAYKLE